MTGIGMLGYDMGAASARGGRDDVYERMLGDSSEYAQGFVRGYLEVAA